MKQSERAVRACATRRGTSAPGGLTNPLSLQRSMFRPRHETAAIRSLKSSISFSPMTFSSPETTRPRSAVPSGVSLERSFRGLPSGQPRELTRT